jgi:SecD/SecF fusion protein
LATNKLDQGVDFVGGRTFRVRSKTSQPNSQKRATKGLAAPYNIWQRQLSWKITTKHKAEERM